MQPDCSPRLVREVCAVFRTVFETASWEVLFGVDICRQNHKTSLGNVQDLGDVSDIGSLCSFLCNASEGSVMSFGCSEFRMHATNAGAQHRWQSAPLYPKRSPVTFKNVEAGLYKLNAFDRKPSICSISAVKAAVSDAKIVMEENECIVLDESCADLAFTDCIFTGKKHFLID
jgi:hypothetical protein